MAAGARSTGRAAQPEAKAEEGESEIKEENACSAGRTTKQRTASCCLASLHSLLLSCGSASVLAAVAIDHNRMLLGPTDNDDVPHNAQHAKNESCQNPLPWVGRVLRVSLPHGLTIVRPSRGAVPHKDADDDC